MEWESDSPCHSHTYPGQKGRSPGRHSCWELEFRDCRAIPGQGLLLTAERWIKGMWGRRLWWEVPVKESQAAMEAREYCWLTCSRWIHHRSLSHPTCQHRQLNKREAGPSKAWWTELESRTPPRVLLYEHNTDLQSRTPARGALCVHQQAELWRKTRRRGLLISSYKRLEKRLW